MAKSPPPATRPPHVVRRDDLRARRIRFAQEKDRWDYILSTYWFLAPDDLLVEIRRYQNFEALYLAARQQRQSNLVKP